MVATKGLLLCQVPPLGAPVNVVEAVAHIAVAPPDIVGNGLIVTVVEMLHPLGASV
jgi:hypothetical protein